MRPVFLLILLQAGAAVLTAEKKPVTLEALHQWRARSRPARIGEAVWAPDGKTFLFRQSSELMLYDIARKRARRVLDLGPLDAAAKQPPNPEKFEWENRRVGEQPLQWEPAGNAALYASGGDLFWIDLSNSKYRQLTDTGIAERDPKLSPDGKTVAFLRDWDLYTLDVQNGKEIRLTTGGTATLRNGAPDWVYPEELALGSAYWWSPDSHSIAYLQFDISGEPLYPHEDLRGTRAVYEPQRYPQAGEDNASIRLGIVEARGGNTKWIGLGDTAKQFLIPRAGWVPDSKSVYVVRTNRVQSELEFLTFNVNSGKSSLAYGETDKYWINVVGNPLFLKNGKEFLWTSEREGGRQVYRYSLNGANPVALTDDHRLNTALVCANDENVFFTSDIEIGQRRFYSAKLDGSSARGGDPKTIFREAGTHRVSMGPGCAYALDNYSSLNSPPETTLNIAAGEELAVFRAADKRVTTDLDFLPTAILQVPGPGGPALFARIIKPPHFDPLKKYPVIVQVYGGPHVQSVRNAWPGVNMDQVFAHAGFVVWQVDNRGTTGRGHSFEAPVFRNLGKAELEDQRAGIEYLISLGFVDRDRIGVNGWSYGGFMTLNMLLNAPDLFNAGFAGAPVTNWLNYDTIYTERYMGLPKDNAAGYARSSLIPKARNLQGQLMIAHNIEDDNVLFQNTLQMIQALEFEGKRFELALYTQKTHGVGGADQRQMEATMLDFFQRHLKPAPPAR